MIKLLKKIIFSIIVITIIIFLVFNVKIQDIILKKIYPKEYSMYVEKYAKEYEVDSNLIYAIIKNESNFKVDAQSNKNAKGLMQLMDSTAEETAKTMKISYVKDDLLKADVNIKLGIKYLSDLIKKYNSIELAIAAYNAGSGNVDNWISKGILESDGSNIENVPFKETNNYVRKILRDYKIYKKLY